MPQAGNVLFVEPDGSSYEVAASSLPETIAYYTPANGAPIPVVRIERSQRGTSMEIKRYAADGSLLDVTMSSPRP